MVAVVLSSPPIERLIRRGGAERVSKAAAKQLAAFLEEYGIGIAKKAMSHAQQDNRKTIRKEDIRKAIKG